MTTTTPATWLANFVANLTTAGAQSTPRVTQLANGNILVTWTSADNGGVGSPAGTDVVGQVFDPLGQAVGAEFLVNTGTSTGNEVMSDIVALPGGGYVAIYDAVVSPGGVSSVIQGFDAAGAPIGTFNIAAPSGSTGGDGRLAVLSPTGGLWVDTLTDTGAGTSIIRGAIIDLTFGAAPVTFDIITVSGTNLNPAVTALAGGTYVVVAETLSGAVSQITLRTVSAAGVVGAEVIVGDTSTNLRADTAPGVTALTNGGFVVAWTSADGGQGDLFLQVFDGAATATSGVITLPGATAAADDVAQPSLVALPSGGFLVIYDDNGAGGQIIALQYTASGAVEGDPVVVATGTGASDVDAVLLGDGRVAVSFVRADGEIALSVLDTRTEVNATGVYTGDQWQVGTVGNDTFTADAAAETIVGHTGEDVITTAVAAGAQAYLMGDGNDTLIVTDPIGSNSYDGGAGVDTIDWSAIATTGNTFNLAAGTASQGLFTQAMTNFENLTGTAQVDTIIGTTGQNVLDGGAGNDSINAGDGNDTLTGGPGNDTLAGGDGIDTVLYLGAAAITVNLAVTTTQATGAGTDRLSGIENLVSGTGNDTLSGSALDNSLAAGAGNDTVNGRDGNDILDGGDGIDTVLFSGAAGVSVDLGQTLSQATGEGSDVITGFENITSGAGNDALTGNEGDNVIDAGAGDDTVLGQGGADTLLAGAGDDSMNGGDGIDSADYSGAVAVTLDLSLTTAQATGYGNDTLSGIENIVAGSGADILTGSALGNTIYAGSGNNSIFGGDGDDLIYAGIGNDVIDGGAGFDLLDYSGTIAVSIDLSLATAQITGLGTETLTNIEAVISGSRNDRLGGNASDNSLAAGSGNDTVSGDAGNDVLDGGVGTDLLDYSGTTPVTVSLASGAPQATGLGDDLILGFENLLTGSGNDSLTGNADDNTLTAGGGDDTLTGGAGNDLLEGGAGTDTADFSGATAVVVSLAIVGAQLTGVGNDTLSGIENLVGGSGADLLAGNAAANSLNGGDGDDTLAGGAGNDILDGGAGTDTVDLTGSGAATVNLGLAGAQATGDGDDTFVNVENAISGGGNDTLTGSADDNSLSAGDGDDTLDGGAGNDILNGGAGVDLLRFTGTGDIAVNLNQLTGQDTGEGTDTLSGFENVATGIGNDTVTGTGLDNSLNGGAGDDSLAGGLGNDTLVGGLGDDTLSGGGGFDLADYSGATAVAVDLGLAVAQDTGIGSDTLLNVENLLTGSGNDSLRGSTQGNTLTAGAGNDTLNGALGNDVLVGLDGIDTAEFSTGANVTVSLAITGSQITGEGSDTLSGIENLLTGGGNDSLTGDGGANLLNGGAGNDTLSGGAGNDALEGGAGEDTASYDGAGDVAVNLSILVAQATGQGNDTLAGIENVVSGLGNDRLTGDSGANSLNAGDGADTVIGGLGDDVLNGGAGTDLVVFAGATAITADLGLSTAQATGLGNDTLLNLENITSGSGADSLRGDGADNTLISAAGNDTLVGGSGNDVLNGGTGTDLADFSGTTAVTVTLALSTAQATGYGNDRLIGIENLLGGDGNDLLTGNALVNSINGAAGDDTLIGGLGNDVMDGGAGSDWVDFSGTVAVAVNLSLTAAQSTGAGGDTLLNFENILSGSRNDRLTGNAQDNTLVAGAGNDTLTGGAGDDRLDGGAGVDTADFAGATAVTVDLGIATAQDTGVGNDTLAGIENLTGGSGNDTLTGNGGTNALNGAAGNDTLIGGAGNDALNGGAGVDLADFSGSTAVTVTLALTTAQATGYGNDTLIGIENLLGGAGNDRLTGSSANNTLTGGAGDDTLVGGLGNDVMTGGLGIDTADFSGTVGITLSLALGGAQTTGVGTDTITAIENVISGSAADRLTGNAQDNTLVAGAGNDTLTGGAGDDRLDGGAGVDTADFAGATAVTVDLGIATAQDTGVGNDTLAGIENLTGGSGNDTLTGNGGNNALNGAAGDDTLIGGAGNDIMTGGAGTDTVSFAGATAVSVNLTLVGAQTTGVGSDTLIQVENLVGSSAADTLTGNAQANGLNGGDGADVLAGGAGNDDLTGGDGADAFVFNAAFSAGNVDQITDYVVADDTIRLENAVFSGLAAGTLAATAFVANTTGLAETTESRIIYRTDTFEVYFDRDGLGGLEAQVFATLTAGLVMSNSEFTVI